MRTKTRNEFLTQADWIFYLYNNLGCEDIKICGGGRMSNGDIFFTKRYSYHELMHLDPNDKVSLNNNKTRYAKVKDFIANATHRTTLDIELCVDVDDKGEFETIKEKTISIIKKLDSLKTSYHVYFTGSKSYHISVIDPNFRRIKLDDRLKTIFLMLLGADALKGSQKQMIALEGATHYKSGVSKQEVALT